MDSELKAALLAATVLLFSSHQTQAQIETSVPFLLIAPDARSEGMGETGTGLADDASAIYWNVGGLGLLRSDHVSANISPWLPEFSSDLTYYFIGYSHYVKEWKGSLAASITYLTIDPGYQLDDPYILQSWTGKDFAATLGYGFQISPGLGVGTNLRVLRSPFNWFGGVNYGGGTDVNTDVALDLGALYRPQKLDLPVIGNFDNRLSLGITMTNLGPRLLYRIADHTEPLPTNLRLGISAHLIKSERHNLYFVLDVTKRMVHYFGGDSVGVSKDSSIIYNPWQFDPLPKSLITSWSNGNVVRSFTFNVGIEYWLGHPRVIALRFGYFDQDPDFNRRHWFTLGGGFRYKAFEFDIAYVSRFDPNNPLSNQLRFSLALNWDRQPEF